MTEEQLKFPIGKFSPKEEYSSSELQDFAKILEEYPQKYRQLTEKLSKSDLQKTYREGSWTIQQLVHHVADMHLLHLLRLKSVLTSEESSNLTMVNIDEWAKTPDMALDIDVPLQMMQSIHHKYAFLVRNMEEKEWLRMAFHPVRQINLTLKQMVYMTVWHTQHHYEHIRIALK